MSSHVSFPLPFRIERKRFGFYLTTPTKWNHYRIHFAPHLRIFPTFGKCIAVWRFFWLLWSFGCRISNTICIAYSPDIIQYVFGRCRLIQHSIFFKEKYTHGGRERERERERGKEKERIHFDCIQSLIKDLSSTSGLPDIIFQLHFAFDSFRQTHTWLLFLVCVQKKEWIQNLEHWRDVLADPLDPLRHTHTHTSSFPTNPYSPTMQFIIFHQFTPCSLHCLWFAFICKSRQFPPLSLIDRSYLHFIRRKGICIRRLFAVCLFSGIVPVCSHPSPKPVGMIIRLPSPIQNCPRRQTRGYLVRLHSCLTNPQSGWHLTSPYITIYVCVFSSELWFWSTWAIFYCSRLDSLD